MAEQAVGGGGAGAREGALGPQRLTTVHAVGQALAVGPIFSAGAVTGLVANVAGFNTPLSILLGSIGALAVAYVISLYARRFVGAGAMYEYLARLGHQRVRDLLRRRVPVRVAVPGIRRDLPGAVLPGAGLLRRPSGHHDPVVGRRRRGAGDRAGAQLLRRPPGRSRRAHARRHLGDPVPDPGRSRSSSRAATRATRCRSSTPARPRRTRSSTGSCSRSCCSSASRRRPPSPRRCTRRPRRSRWRSSAPSR